MMGERIAGCGRFSVVGALRCIKQGLQSAGKEPAMHEPLLERIRQLETSLRRWRLACIASLIVVVSLVAIGGTFGVMMLLQLPDRREMMMRADAERERALAEQAMHAERVARQQAEQALKAERAAHQQGEGKADGP
jgi:hypothetical protein